MIKADANSLEELKRSVNSSLKEFNARMEEIRTMQFEVSQCWNDEQGGSFIETLKTIYSCRDSVQVNCNTLERLIDEMLQIISDYNKIRF